MMTFRAMIGLWLLLIATQGCGSARRYVKERNVGTMDEAANTTSTSDESWEIERTPAAAARQKR